MAARRRHRHGRDRQPIVNLVDESDDDSMGLSADNADFREPPHVSQPEADRRTDRVRSLPPPLAGGSGAVGGAEPLTGGRTYRLGPCVIGFFPCLVCFVDGRERRGQADHAPVFGAGVLSRTWGPTGDIGIPFAPSLQAVRLC